MNINVYFVCKAYHLYELFAAKRITCTNFSWPKRITCTNFLNFCGELSTGNKDEELLILCGFEAVSAGRGLTWLVALDGGNRWRCGVDYQLGVGKFQIEFIINFPDGCQIHF